MKFKKIITIIMIAITIISISSLSYAKYVFDYTKKAIKLDIDRTSPILRIEYSNKELTDTDVEVKIIANERIKQVEGWQLLEDEKTLLKVYDKNIEETIIVKDLSENESEAKIQINNIDKEPPKAEIIEISNTNQGYEKYANKESQITLKIKISDDNKIINNLQDFKILVGAKENVYTKETKILEEKENYIIYEIKLTNILENGKLIIEIPENSFKDIMENKLEKTILDTKIQIDNIAPIVQYSQEELENGKVVAKITGDEPIRAIDGWQLNDDGKIISKEFISNIKYSRIIKDLAGNIANIEIKVENATFLGLDVKSHISRIGWRNSENNVIGIMEEGNIKNKFECLLFRTSNNVDADFLQASSYVYSYWGEGSSSKSVDFGIVYNYGYNPISGYKTMNNSELATYEGEQYIFIGGDGLNRLNNTDINGNNPIPREVASSYKYGISSIKLDLKEHSEYSIIYQIFFDDTGWLKTCKNGEEAIRQKDQPIEAMRFAVIPTSELEFVVQEWDKNIGTYNLD